MIYALAFALTLAIVLLIVPILTKSSHKVGFVDKPTSRKKHPTPTPLAGGIAMFVGFMIAYFIFVPNGEEFSGFSFFAIPIGATLITAVGVVDDYYKTKGKEFAILPRVLIQLLVCGLMFAANIRFTGFMNPVTDTYVLLPLWLQFVLTVTWIFGIMTVMNFSDGMDGLAGGLTAICACTLFIAALSMGQNSSALMAIILIAAALAFLRYNFFPAKIFMGDSGATFLGFMLAVISLHGAFKQATLISVLVPVLALGVPILDNIFVVLKRFVNKTPVYKADASQIHYRLLKTGLKPVQVVQFILLISVCLNLTSIIILLLSN